MKNKRFSKTFALFTLILLAFISTASGATIYGPEKLVRSDGTPDVFARTFETTAGTGKLIVKNGEDNGEKRVPYSISSARISINGKEIFGPSDFKQTAYSMEADIDLNQSNLLIVELGSQPGDFLTVSIEQDIQVPVSISITSPVEGETISASDVIFKGLINNTLGNEVRVSINGIPAFVEGDKFVSDKIPLKKGINLFTATATTESGIKADQSITINAETSEEYVKLNALANSGVAPLETVLKVNSNLSISGDPSISYTGPGIVELTESEIDGEYNLRILSKGIYNIKAEVLNTENNIYKDEITLVVFDEFEQDTLIKATWNGMKEKLVSGDVTGALDYFSPFSRGTFEEIFNALGENVSRKAAEMEDVTLIYINENIAKYRIKKNELINNENHRITYYIYFVRDVFGNWHIDDF